MKIINSVAHKLGKLYCEKVCEIEFATQKFRRINERPIEFGFVFQQLAKTCPVTVLDVGTGTTALPSLMQDCGFVVTAIDNVKDYWPSGMFNRHYLVIDDDIRRSALTQAYDFISCISVLEHITDSDAAVDNMFRLLMPGGHMALTFPYNELEYVPNVYELVEASYGKGLPYVCQAYSRAQLAHWIARNAGEIVEQQYWRFWKGKFWTCGEQIVPPIQVSKDEPHQLTCLLIRKLR